VSDSATRMKSPPTLPPIPWKTIGIVLATAAFIAWAVGFVVGLVVRLALGS
jgi:hypothetical protein